MILFRKEWYLLSNTKKGVENIGIVGIENTLIVTAKGGECISEENPGLTLVY
jgi:Xaa-Pro dipeptidase